MNKREFFDQLRTAAELKGEEILDVQDVNGRITTTTDKDVYVMVKSFLQKYEGKMSL